MRWSPLFVCFCLLFLAGSEYSLAYALGCWYVARADYIKRQQVEATAAMIKKKLATVQGAGASAPIKEEATQGGMFSWLVRNPMPTKHTWHMLTFLALPH